MGGRRGGDTKGHFRNYQVLPEAPNLPDPDGVAPSRGVFEVVDVDLAVINGLRRLICAGIQTVAVPYDPTNPATNVVLAPGMSPPAFQEAGFRMYKNTTVLHNEFLLHRISLVPIHVDENRIQGYSPSIYLFRIKVKNQGDETISVTSKDIQVMNEGGAALDAERDALYPPSAISGDHVLIVELKPGEELHVEFRARLGTGREHAAFKPTSKCYAVHKIDEAAKEAALASYLAMAKAKAAESSESSEPSGPSEEEVLASARADFMMNRAHKFFVKDRHGDPSASIFTVDSVTRLRPAYMVFAAFLVMLERLHKLRTAIRGLGQAKAAKATKAMASDSDEWGRGGDDDGDYDDDGGDMTHPSGGGGGGGMVRIVATPNADDMYQIFVPEEDHTIGNVVQSLLYRHLILDAALPEATVSHIGYEMPHPTEYRIVFTVKCAQPGLDISTVMDEGLAWAIEYVEALAVEWVDFVGDSIASIQAVKDGLARIQTMAKKLMGV